MIKTLNTAKKDSILSSIMAFTDINQTRETLTKNFVVYNDVEKEVSKDVISALENYGVKNIPWSKKETSLQELALN